jgi:hypothetical protein
MTATPVLDAIASDARSWLSVQWDEIASGDGAATVDERNRAAIAAALAAASIGPPDAGSIRATDDQLERAERVMAAWGELGEIGRGDAPEAGFAAGLVRQVGRPGSGDVARAGFLLRAVEAIARFVAFRPGGLVDDAVDLWRGAADLDGVEWGR